jgi:hypothetical protein
MFRMPLAPAPPEAESIEKEKPAADLHSAYLTNKHTRLSSIFEANDLWVKKKTGEDPDYFKKLSAGHTPKYFWIGCSDARVPANEIMGEDAGSVFVVRNVANQIHGLDSSAMSALQFVSRPLNPKPCPRVHALTLSLYLLRSLARTGG